MSGVSGRVIILSSLAALAIMFLAIIAFVVTNKADLSRRDLPVLGRVPSFSFVDQNNQPFTQDSLSGKLNIVSFIFTSCQGACPVMMKKYQALSQGFASSPNIRFIAVTVDPETDSTARLKFYGDSLGLTAPNSRFLYAPKEQVASVMEQGFQLASDNLPSGHPTKLILVDGNGEIRGYYDGMDEASVDVLKAQLRELVKQYP